VSSKQGAAREERNWQCLPLDTGVEQATLAFVVQQRALGGPDERFVFRAA